MFEKIPMGQIFSIFLHKEMFLKFSTFLQNNLISVEIAKGTMIFFKYGELRFYFFHN
jgi:hypothetical protein